MVWNNFDISSGFLSTSSEMQHLADNFEAWYVQDSGAPSVYWDALPCSESSHVNWYSAAGVWYYPAAGVWRVSQDGYTENSIHVSLYVGGVWRYYPTDNAGTFLTDGSIWRVSGNSSTVRLIKLGDY